LSILSTLLISLFFTSNVFAVQLAVPDIYQLIKVNGKATSSNFFSSETLVDLKLGRNIIVLRYSELFEDDDYDDHATIKSEPQIVLFTIANMKVNNYSFISPNIVDEQQARQYAKAPIMKIEFTDKITGKATEIDLLSKNLTEFEAEVAFQKMEKFNLSNSVNSKHAIDVKENTSSVNALEKLKQWWALADEKQKQQFIDFTEQ